MSIESLFDTLVRQNGAVFRASPEADEQVVTISDLNLSGSQVATEADLMMAGYVKRARLTEAEAALARAEAERAEVAAQADAEKRALAAEHDAVRERLATRLTRLQQDLEDTRGDLAALKARLAHSEAVVAAEVAGIQARDRGEPIEGCPYGDDEDHAAERQAWRNGHQKRDVLLKLKESQALALTDAQRLGAENARLVEALGQREEIMAGLRAEIVRLNQERDLG